RAMKPATCRTAVSAPKPRRPRPRGRRRGSLDLYLDRASRYERLEAEQEHEQLANLVELRRRRWQVLLSERAALPSLLSRIEDALSELPPEPLAAVRRAANDEDAEALGRAVVALATELESHDANGTLVESLCDELPLDALDPDTAREHHARVRRAIRGYRRARNRFVCANLRLVVKVADRYSGRFMSLADRVQEGNLGLLKAIERFDPDRGTRFSTYAVWWIRHAITRALVNRGRVVRVPAHLHVVFTKVRAAREALQGELGRPPTLPELAEHVELPVAKVEAAVEAMERRAVSIDRPDDEGSGPAWSDRLGVSAPQQQIDAGLDERRHETLAMEALDELDPRDRDILEQRFELGGRSKVTLETLGKSLELSRERVRQLQNRALTKLRRELEHSPQGVLAFA
ncbi:MAG: RNA polymerase sigma factor RpoD/SigA, partial [Nannocystaceae bacterium]